MMFWPGHDVTGWGWTAMTIGMLLFWGLLIAGAILLVRGLDRSARGAVGPARPSPEEVLAERYARGEIDEEEYRRRLSTLSGNWPTPTR